MALRDTNVPSTRTTQPLRSTTCKTGAIDARFAIASFRAFLARDPMRLDILVPFVLTLAMLAIEPHLQADDKAHVGYH